MLSRPIDICGTVILKATRFVQLLQQSCFWNSFPPTWRTQCNLSCEFCCQISQDANTLNPSSRYISIKKLLGSVESGLQSPMKNILGISFAILACSLPQSSLLLHIANQDLREDHLGLECTILIKDKNFSTHILIDIGAFRYAFISDSFAQTHDHI